MDCMGLSEMDVFVEQIISLSLFLIILYQYPSLSLRIWMSFRQELPSAGLSLRGPGNSCLHFCCTMQGSG